MSEDGDEPRTPEETSNGGKKLSSETFWKAVDKQKLQSTIWPPNEEISAERTIHSTLSLEERLSIAQSQGLGPNLRRQLAFVGPNERVFEFQSLGVRRYPQDSFDKSRASHARSPDEAVALCTEADAWIAHGIYILPARLRPGVETRHLAPGRWYDVPKSGGTTDSDVATRLILAVDFDVKRSSAISATEEEMQRSVRVAQNAWSYIAHHLGESSLAYLHSGNGRQIHIALDAIPATDESRRGMAGLLAGLAHLFNTDEVTVDEKLSDAKRILPACGTVKKKGAPGVDERPHRRTAIVTPDAPTRVSLDHIIELTRTIWEESSVEGRAAIEKAIGIKLLPPTPGVVSAIQPKPESPFAQANEVDPQAVAEWLGLYNARREVVCPGCGETEGVSVIKHGLKCFHNRCKDKGRDGFRTNVDLVMEVHHLTASKDAVIAISDRFGLNLVVGGPTHSQTATQNTASPDADQIDERDELDKWAPAIGEHLKTSVARAVRRWIGIEKPVPLPWDELKDHFGGGLWPGVHVLCSGTGVGKTAAVLQVCMNAAENGVPTAYVGLEMDDLQFDLRVVGETAKLRWSDLYTGQSKKELLEHAATVAVEIVEKKPSLPLHPVNRNPMGWPASSLNALAAALRQKYPEPPLSETLDSGGPGSRPILIVLDYLQIIGPEENEDGRYKTLDLRERIGRAAYALREVATTYNITILVVASVARDKYGLWPMVMNAELQWEMDGSKIVGRRVGIPDVLVGLGKESGEIEYGADSVSVLSRVPDTYVDGQGESVVFVTAKGRATGARWTPMHFTGFRYESTRDGGESVLEALQKNDRAKEQKRAQKEEEKRQAEEATVQKKIERADARLTERERRDAADQDACLRVIARSPGIGSVELRAAMKAELSECGKDRANAAIYRCENVTHTIEVVRRNDRDVRHYPAGWDNKSREERAARSEKTPIPPSDGATRATRGGDGSATPATPAIRQSSERNESGNKWRESTATPATPATRDVSTEKDVEADSDALFELDEVEWRSFAKTRGWPDRRLDAAIRLAKPRQQKASDDWQVLRQVELRGEDLRAWATEKGWSDEKTRDAMRFLGRTIHGAASESSDPPPPRKRGRPDPAYADPTVLEANAAALLEVIDGGMTVREIETSPRNQWTPVNVEVLLTHLVGDGRLVNRGGRYFKK